MKKELRAKIGLFAISMIVTAVTMTAALCTLGALLMGANLIPNDSTNTNN